MTTWRACPRCGYLTGRLICTKCGSVVEERLSRMWPLVLAILAGMVVWAAVIWLGVRWLT